MSANAPAPSVLEAAPITGPHAAIMFAQHVEELRRLLEYITMIDAGRHGHGFCMQFNAERIELKAAIAFLDAIRCQGYVVPAFGPSHDTMIPSGAVPL